jgi:hypothetical protein
MIEQQRVYRIKGLDSLLVFLREDLCWDLPDASIDDVSFEWTGLDLNLSEDVNKKLKDGLIRQLQPFATHQPWGIFVVEFATREVSIITLRQILRCFVAKRRGARPDLPAWQCENLLFICLYGENGFTFAHFKGDKPYSSKLTTFSWHPGEPVRTVCEFNLPALVYDYTWTPETWVEEWQKAFDVEKVNKDFYKQIARFYYRLTGKEGQKRELVLPYVGDDLGSISIYEEFAVRLIGRTIFCWFLKHKESENDVPLISPEALSLAAARETEAFYHAILEPLFFEVMNKRVKERKPLAIPRSEIIPFLNGGLFESHHNDFYAGASNYGLKIPDAWFIDFFSLLERYNFTITENSSIDVDVAVDPEMLGRIFENLLAEVVPETGETARKATGTYYTPRAIVDYMVEQSLKQYLLTKTELGEEKVNRLVDYGEDINDFSPEEKLAVVTALREIKVIDPACGSGAFPMGILHRMLAVLEKVDPRLELWQAQYLKSLDGIVRQTVEKNISRENWAYIRKLMIIRDSIYGVDIKSIAVEIAKLRCFLSLVVDEIVLDNEENRGIEPLPNLEFKFVAANTLIGLPPRVETQGAFGASEAIKKLKELRESYLRSFGAEKAQIEKEFRATQQKLFKENVQWAVADTLVKQLTEWDPFSYESCGWFDPGWMFGVEDGFDIVIANPPYLKERDNKEIFEIVNQSSFGMKYHQGKMDFWYYFLHKAIDIAKNNGIISYITSRYWLNSSGAKKLIRRVKEELCFIQFIDIGKLKVFDEVAGQHMVAVYQKTKDKPEFVYKRIINDLSDISESKDTENLQISTLSKKDVFSKNDEIILEKFSFDHSNTISLGQITDISQGVVEATDKISYKQLKKINKSNYTVGQGVFVLTQKEVDSLKLNSFEKLCVKRYLDPNNVGKYSINFTDRYLIYADNQTRKQIETNKNYSTLKGHLDHFRCFITSSNGPYGLHRPREKKYFDNPKIIFINMFVDVGFTYDENDNYYFGFSFSSILQKDIKFNLKFILAILNSKFAQSWFYKNGKKRGAGVDIGVEKLRLFPIKDVSQTLQKPFILLVAQIHAITKDKDYANNPTKQAKVKELEHQIDQMVYELYGLTLEETAVEGETK